MKKPRQSRQSKNSAGLPIALKKLLNELYAKIESLPSDDFKKPFQSAIDSLISQNHSESARIDQEAQQVLMELRSQYKKKTPKACN